MKNELLGKDEISINVGGVDFTASKIEEMIRSHTLQNTEAARLLRGQQIELDCVKAQLEKAEKVIEFYGAKENWRDEADSGVKVFGPFKDHKTWTDCGYEYDWENLHDQGEKAREYFADKDKK